jgi:hypothetical protein
MIRYFLTILLFTLLIQSTFGNSSQYENLICGPKTKKKTVCVTEKYCRSRPLYIGDWKASYSGPITSDGDIMVCGNRLITINDIDEAFKIANTIANQSLYCPVGCILTSGSSKVECSVSCCTASSTIVCDF